MPEYETILTGLHILGAIIGMGAAFTSDAIFFSSIRDEKVSRTELRFIKLGGRLVWIGLGLIVLSGALLFLGDPEYYLASAKFLSKMTIVGVLVVNGALFHLIHIPRFHRHANHHFPSSDEFMRAVPLLLAGGVVSTVSWFSALALGLWRGMPYAYLEVMGAYLVLLAFGACFTILFKKHFVPHSRK